MAKRTLVRNEEGLFVNIDVFRKPALFFEENGRYTLHKRGTWFWDRHWQGEAKKVLQGVEIGGVQITGEHYYYLNYSRMKKVDIVGGMERKVEGFPDFWDGDYNYYHIKNIARNGAVDPLMPKDKRETAHNLRRSKDKRFLKHARKYLDKLGLFYDIEDDFTWGGFDIVVGKSRRKGYSYKAGAAAGVNFHLRPGAITVFAASDSKFVLPPKGVFQFVWNNIQWQTKHTGFAQPMDKVRRYADGMVKASAITYTEDGEEVETGLMSAVYSYTYYPNVDVLRGDDVYEVNYEESGVGGPPGTLIDSISAAQDTMKAGSYKTGQLIVWGTSGDLESGTVDYMEIYTNPLKYGMLPLKDIWKDDEASPQYEGFFHPVHLNMEGFYDENGNSDLDGAKEYELAAREEMKRRGASEKTIVARQQNRPLNSEEAFFTGEEGFFNVGELRKVLKEYIVNNYDKLWKPYKLIPAGNDAVEATIVKCKNPIMSFHRLPQNLEGCFMVLEPPDANAPKGTYYIGYDPVRQDDGTSLSVITVIKGDYVGNKGLRDTVVAEYVGRHVRTEETNDLAFLIAMWYGEPLIHENEVTSVKTAAMRSGKTKWLARQPDAVISKSIRNSKVRRGYGMHMTTELKMDGLRYLRDWLLGKIDTVDDKPVYRYMTIKSRRFLEELIAFNFHKNFDYISAAIMAMYRREQVLIAKAVGKSSNTDNSKLKKISKKVSSWL